MHVAQWQDAKIEPFQITVTRQDSAASAHDAFTESAKLIKVRLRLCVGLIAAA